MMGRVGEERMSDPEVTARLEIANTAQQVLNGQLSVIEGCRSMDALGSVADLRDDPDFVVIIVVVSETDELPSPSELENWHPDVRAERRLEWEAAEHWARATATHALGNLLGRFAR